METTSDETAKEAAEKVAEEGIRWAADEVAEWASLWSGIDEQMAWPTSCWEVDAYDALNGDVLWDCDIWDFKSNTNPPGNSFE